jgi:histidine triad (HIT) family protein
MTVDTGSTADCLFCKIASRAISAKEVYRDADIVAIEDINPQAPLHVLVMPVKHFADAGSLAGVDDALLGKVVAAAARIGREHGGRGYRLVANTGADGGQTVAHLHVHVLAGRPMHWPPG